MVPGPDPFLGPNGLSISSTWLANCPLLSLSQLLNDPIIHPGAQAKSPGAILLFTSPLPIPLSSTRNICHFQLQNLSGNLLTSHPSPTAAASIQATTTSALDRVVSPTLVSLLLLIGPLAFFLTQPERFFKNKAPITEFPCLKPFSGSPTPKK